MTTKDIAALREAIKACDLNDYRTWPQLPPRRLEALLNKLEAERHKGDLWFGKVADLEAALKAERQRADEYKGQLELEQHHSKTLSGTVDIVDGQRDHWMERARKAEAEIAALKGDQVPVADGFPLIVVM